ncbi:hypothetical protein Dimus_004100 [Dionaea muscipula]
MGGKSKGKDSPSLVLGLSAEPRDGKVCSDSLLLAVGQLDSSLPGIDEDDEENSSHHEAELNLDVEFDESADAIAIRPRPSLDGAQEASTNRTSKDKLPFKGQWVQLFSNNRKPMEEFLMKKQDIGTALGRIDLSGEEDAAKYIYGPNLCLVGYFYGKYPGTGAMKKLVHNWNDGDTNLPSNLAWRPKQRDHSDHLSPLPDDTSLQTIDSAPEITDPTSQGIPRPLWGIARVMTAAHDLMILQTSSTYRVIHCILPWTRRVFSWCERKGQAYAEHDHQDPPDEVTSLISYDYIILEYSNHIDFLAILETKLLSDQKLAAIMKTYFASNFHTHPAGRTLLLWNMATINIDIISASDQVIHARVICKRNGPDGETILELELGALWLILCY